ncbi:adenine phosphoribosyltransferase [Neisseria sp. Ec49-e6-T10]|uniref:adenine phosphoribosyltransferase n=1 Tax=Neisseria sp. Ec49-e6-T10 TaxID=3140744 RepID=UPI003EBD4B5C
MNEISDLDYAQFIEKSIRKIPNWPAPGILFHDITPLLQNPKTFRILIDIFVHRYLGEHIDYIVGLDARGFILGSAIAYQLNVGFIPIRKKGKLPFDTVSETYELEYGNAAVEIHSDAVKKGDRVVLIDDLIATGGTMLAGHKLLKRLEAEVVEAAAIIEFNDLAGGQKIRETGLPLFTVCQVNGTLK